MLNRRNLIGCLSAVSALNMLPWAAHGNQAFAELSALLQRLLADNAIRGGQVLIADHGRIVFHESVGLAGVSGEQPMHPTTVLSMQSLTKPVIAVAILKLKEHGKLSLTDPVSRFIPELKALNKVRVVKPGSPAPFRRMGSPPGPEPQYDIVTTQREITIKDLLTHTAGLQQIDIPNAALPPVTETDTLATWVPKIAVMSLDHQPGAAWGYSNIVSFDVLARIVEVVSAQPVDVFLQQHILQPLNMADTGFGARYDQRAARVETMGPSGRPAVAEGRNFKSGAAGLWSTLPDFARFMQMLANGGTLHGHRLLKSTTVKMMTSNQIGSLYRGSNLGDDPGRSGLGFGLSLEVVLDAMAAQAHVPNGSYGWNGAGGSKAWVIPAQKRVLLMKVAAPAAQLAIEATVTAIAPQRGGVAV